MIPRETLSNGAPSTCPDCGIALVPGPCRSAAGWYIGTACACGPFSRESGYYATRDDAAAALAAGTATRVSGFTGR